MRSLFLAVNNNLTGLLDFCDILAKNLSRKDLSKPINCQIAVFVGIIFDMKILFICHIYAYKCYKRTGATSLFVVSVLGRLEVNSKKTTVYAIFNVCIYILGIL